LQEKEHNYTLRTVFICFACLLGLWLLKQYLLPCILPFILALFTARLLEPVVTYLNSRLRLKRGFSSFVCLFILLFSAVGVFALIIVRLYSQAVELIKELPQLGAGLPRVFEVLTGTVTKYINAAPAGVRDYLHGAIKSVFSTLSELPGRVSAAALQKLSGLAGSTPGVVLFCAAYVVGTFFISRTFPEIRQFLIRQIPPRFRETARRLKNDVVDSLALWLKAQLTLMLITFCELTLALTLLRVRYSVIIALVTAIIDSLPVFGTGVVLVPWAVAEALSGRTRFALSLAAVYLTVSVVRGFMEPKLVGAKSGINPAAALLATYSGFRLVGVWGMLLFPAGLVVLKQMNDKGYVKLWK